MTTSHTYRVRESLREIKYEDWEFIADYSEDRVYIYAQWRGADSFSPAMFDTHRTRRWLIRPDASHSEIVQTAFKCVLTAIEHEARERFLYRGRAVFGPHHDVDYLWELSAHMEPT